MNEFPRVYPCSSDNFCESGCCHPVSIFTPFEEQIIANDFYSKESVLPSIPTKLAAGRYTWDIDSSSRKYEPGSVSQIPLRNRSTIMDSNSRYEETERTIIRPRVPKIYQKSEIEPPQSVVERIPRPRFQRNANNQEVESHYKRVVKKVIKNQLGTKEGKIVEEDGKTLYFVNGRKVSRDEFNKQEWF